MFSELMTLSQHFLDIHNQAYRRYFIKNVPRHQRMNILIGARGIGKTTTLIQDLLDYAAGDRFSQKILYVQADHFLIAESSLYEIAEQFVAHGGSYLAIDEIHKYPNWSIELKSIYDTFNELKIFASGSSALEIHKGSHDLSRRALVFHMQGMSFREYLELYNQITLPHFTLEEIFSNHTKLAHEIIAELKKINKHVLPEFLNYTQFGYYPYFRDIKDPADYYQFLEQNVHVTLESDLVAVYPQLNGNSLRKIKQLLAFIATSVPFTPNWAKIKTIVDVGDLRTLKTYFKYLEDAGLIKTLSKASNKLAKVESPEKVFLNNPNLLYALTATAPNKGTIRETFFLDMLAKDYAVAFPPHGDVLVENKYLFEIGGRNKDITQIQNSQNAFLALDDIESGNGNKIPLWLFGFLY